MALDEADIVACSGYAPVSVDEESIEAVRRSVASIASDREARRDRMCLKGPCKHNVDMRVGYAPIEGSEEYRQYCTKVCGAARLYDVEEKPVFSCSAWEPASGISFDEAREFYSENRSGIESQQRKMGRYDNDDDESFSSGAAFESGETVDPAEGEGTS